MSCACNSNKVLDTPIEYDDAGGDTTLRETLKLILKTLFHEGEGFSGKHPLGNSSWEASLAIGLVKAGLMEGTLLDDSGYDVDFEWAEFHKVTDEAIEAL